jgi:cephalosporin hydroxylase
MFPFWEVAIAPVLRAARARRVVEIGALRGDNTKQLLDHLGAEAELHVIDPVPDFDPAEHEAQFPGRYVFHRDLSVNVLPHLEPMDAALIDGDHNWYTVYQELSLLREVARKAGAPLPVMLMHDVGWPYGRRDLYYDPETVPAEHRQPYRQAGMRQDRKKLLPKGGLNPTMYNAEVEGGPRNGVMTALDDWMAEHDTPLRLVFLPVYYGLAIVAEEERLQRQPELAAVMDRLESAEGKHDLMLLAEDTRLRGMIFQHNVFYQKNATIDRLASRYLSTVKGALLNEHYLETEVRLAHLADSVERGRAPNTDKLRDPVRHDKYAFRDLQEQRRTGQLGERRGTGYAFTAMGRLRLDHLEQCLDALAEEKLPGDLVECGTGRGGGAMFMKAWLAAHEVPGRTVWVADPFDGTTSATGSLDGLGADLNSVRDGFARFELLDDDVRFLQGAVDATLVDAPIGSIALLRIGPGLGPSVRAALELLHDKVVPGGFVIVEGAEDEAYAAAIEAFRAERALHGPLQQIDAGTWAWRRHADDGTATATPVRPAAGLSHAPLAPPVREGTCDLSVVIVAYDMRREMVRSLRALTRAYQRGIEDLDYEVIVVENGSPPEGRLDPDWVRSFGPEFRYVDMGADATPSPTVALNRGIEVSRGTNLALMVDGAHILTPGVLRFGMAGLTTYAPAIVATQQWYVGPGQQGDAMQTGYDQDYEDKLFEGIAWPEDGYRLFDIGHFVGTRDWFDGVWESNCLFVPRSVVEQAGGFDDGFSMPGGGYTNLEIYERLGSTPGVTVASIIGEGSFHQVHGGTTTNQVDPEERRARVFGYGEHFKELRGRRFISPNKPIHYVGGLQTSSARRTHPRRMTATAFANAQSAAGPDGRPDEPAPMAEDLRASFVEAYWRTLVWRNTTWLGQRVPIPPTDLVTYQEIVATVRPDVIIETGTGGGGRALFLASVCEAIDHGRVISVDPKLGDDLPQHPRLTYLEGQAHADSTLDQVRGLVGDGSNGFVILGSRGSAQRMKREFDAYCGFAGVGSYVVIEDTILNGHPVFPGFGPGPAEGANRALAEHGEFVVDSAMEKHALTFNPGGFLRRVR